METSFAPIATLLAASIAALVSTLSAFLTAHYARRNLKKEISLKVAEYRLAWINNLGDEIAIFLASSMGSSPIDLAIHATRPPAPKDRSEERREMIRSAARIDLLMNHKDPEYQLLKQRMAAVKAMALVEQGELKVVFQQWTEARAEFISTANSILKREWSRTKQHLKADTVEVDALRSSDEPPPPIPFWQRIRMALDVRVGC